MLEGISKRFGDIVRQIGNRSHINEKNIEEAVESIKTALLDADVNLRVVRRFINKTIEEAKGEKVLRAVKPGEQFVKIVHDRMVHFLGDQPDALNLKGRDALSVILLMGLQGSGKTTTAAKLANHLRQKEQRKVLLIAADLERPAAIDQLRQLGQNIGVEVYNQGENDSLKVVENGLAQAARGDTDTVIIDTSGRMHIDAPLMKQLKEINKLARPTEQLLVADAMSGQQVAEIAKEFNEQTPISGIILSKFDSDTRGGAALSLKTVTGKSVKFIGVGEKPQDLEPFYPERIASRILGMGDVVSLVEKAQEQADEKEAAELESKIRSASFTLQDYLEQFQKVKKMGSIDSLLEMLPGGANLPENVNIDEKDMKRKEAIILSMTKQERLNHRIIGSSRRQRIAKGSGVSLFKVNHLLKEFEKMRQTMKKMVKNKKYQQKFMQQFGNM